MALSSVRSFAKVRSLETDFASSALARSPTGARSVPAARALRGWTHGPELCRQGVVRGAGEGAKRSDPHAREASLGRGTHAAHALTGRGARNAASLPAGLP